MRYNYLSINTLRQVTSLQSHLNGRSTDVSIDSRIGSVLPVGPHVRIFILACHLCMRIRTILKRYGFLVRQSFQPFL